jgi:hypothetical protein
MSACCLDDEGTIVHAHTVHSTGYAAYRGCRRDAGHAQDRGRSAAVVVSVLTVRYSVSVTL